MCNNRCCTPKVEITSYTPGATFLLGTTYSFANAKNCNKFCIDLDGTIPSQTTITPVAVSTSSGTPATLPLSNCLNNNVMSDQLVGVGKICVAFGNNPVHLKVLKVFDICGNEICLRDSAFYATVEDDVE